MFNDMNKIYTTFLKYKFGDHKIKKKKNKAERRAKFHIFHIYISHFLPGIPKLGILPVDPLFLTSLEIGQGSGPVSIDLHLTNASIHGLKKAVIKNVK